MDFIKELGITLLVGAFTILGAEAILHYFFNKQLSGFFHGKLGFEERGNVTVAIFIAFAFAVGIVVEDLSYKYRDSHEIPFKTIPAQVLPDYIVSKLGLPQELDDRVTTLINDLNGVLPKPQPLALALANNQAFQISDTSNYANKRKFETNKGNSGAKVERWIRDDQRCIPDSRYSDCPATKEITNGIDNLYYYAKNKVYAHEQHAEELRRIQTRLEFTRSLSLIAFFYMLIALALGTALFSIHLFGFRQELVKRKVIPTKTERLDELSKRIPILLATLAVIYFLSLWAFALETENFNRRAYGYFSTMLISEKRTASDAGGQQSNQIANSSHPPIATPAASPTPPPKK